MAKKKLKKTFALYQWQIATAVLALLLLVAIFTGGFGIQHGNSAQMVASDALDFVNTNMLSAPAVATLEGVEEKHGLYLLQVNVQGDAYELYETQDGEMLFTQGITLDDVAVSVEEEPVQEIPQQRTPEVELFVMSHCPYGTQIEKGILPVLETLEDEIDFELKFVNYAMHGEVEVEEQLNQYCIQEDYSAKLQPYLACFLEEGDGAACLAEVGLTEQDLASCRNAADEEYQIFELLNDQSQWDSRFPPFNVHDAENEAYGVRGSPTLVVNGEVVNSGRDSASLLATICGGFKNAPAACDVDLSSFGNPSPGFGYDAAAAAATAADCGI